MDIYINDKKHTTYWDEPQLKNNKDKIISLKINESFSGELEDIIIISKYRYHWLLKGCKLLKNIDIGDRFFDVKVKSTNLVISYDEKYGSPNREDIDREIRDWNLRKLIS
jgi:hypothetical protein